MQNRLCSERNISFNIYESFKAKFNELVTTNSLLILHANLYFLEATNYVIIPLENETNYDDYCINCSSGCKWNNGTRVGPSLVYTKFIVINRTDDADEAFEIFETKRLADKMAYQHDHRLLYYDFPFQNEADLKTRCQSV